MALLEVWKTFEETHGTAEDVRKVQGMMPIVSKKRHVDQETGQMVEGSCPIVFLCQSLSNLPTDWDLVFADDERESNPTSFKFLQMAHAWKTNQNKTGDGPAKPVLSGLAAASASKPKDDDATSDVASSHGGD